MRDRTPRELCLATTLLRGVGGGRLLASLLPDIEARFSDPPRLSEAQRARWRQALKVGALERQLDAELEALEMLQASFLTPLCGGWPRRLPPFGVLRLRGRVPLDGLAIVGTRRADRYGRDVAGAVARSAVEADLAVISGGAYGIDVAAHRATLEAGGETVVVLGAGLGHVHPAAHRPVFEAAEARGAVVSPFPCAQTGERWTFPRRNRWIAGLARATVLVQGGEGSGALYTVNAALALGRPVWAVPGLMNDPRHQACHALIGRGAGLLQSPGGWHPSAGQLGWRFGAGEAPSAHGAQEAVASARPLEEYATPPAGPAGALWRAAGSEPLPLSRIAREAGLPIREAGSLATILELQGWLQPASGGRYMRSGRQAKR